MSISQMTRIRESRTFTSTPLLEPRIIIPRKSKCGSSKNLILKTLRENNYNSIKTIKSFMKQKISYGDIASNIDRIENGKEKEQLLSIISQWKHFSFCDKELLDKEQEDQENCQNAKGNDVNIFIQHIYDLNSQKNDSSMEEEEGDYVCHDFEALKSKSTEEKPIYCLKTYQNDFSHILENDHNEKLRISFIKQTNSIQKKLFYDLLSNKKLYITKKVTLLLTLKQIMLLCYKYKEIKTESKKQDCFALEQVNVADFIKKINYFEEENLASTSKLKDIIPLPNLNTNVVDIQFSYINNNSKAAAPPQHGLLLDKYLIRQEISTGSYWSMNHCTDMLTQKKYFIKIIHKTHADYNKEQHYHDLFMLIKASFSHIMKVKEVIDSKSYGYLIFVREEDAKPIESLNNFVVKKSQSEDAYNIYWKLARSLISIVDYSVNVLKINSSCLNTNNLFVQYDGNISLFSFSQVSTSSSLSTEITTLYSLHQNHCSSNELVKVLKYLYSGDNSSIEKIVNDKNKEKIKQFLMDISKEGVSFEDIKSHTFITSTDSPLPNIYDCALEELNSMINLQIHNAKYSFSQVKNYKKTTMLCH